MKQKLFHYGCSFTENIRSFKLHNLFTDKYDYHNHGLASSGNGLIFDTFKKTAESDSIAILQWSSLTRPRDENYKILETSDNPLYDYLEEWYGTLSEAREFSNKNNIKLVQYIGWAEWKDSELNDYHRNKLQSFGIHWFKSKKQWDIIASNCFQFEDPYEWSSPPRQLPDGEYFLWSDIEWGGMSEWIRSNIEIHDRYRGWTDDTVAGTTYYDPHPSEYASIQFIKEFLLKTLEM
jgi:hypothetical protein